VERGEAASVPKKSQKGFLEINDGQALANPSQRKLQR
jgi:hypothetical protein